MAIAAYFLVGSPRARGGAARGLLVLVATHLGTAFLLGSRLARARGRLPRLRHLARPGDRCGSALRAGVDRLRSEGGTRAAPRVAPRRRTRSRRAPSPRCSRGRCSRSGSTGSCAAPVLGPPPLGWGVFLLATASSPPWRACCSRFPARLKRPCSRTRRRNVGIIVAGVGLGVLGAPRVRPASPGRCLRGSAPHVWVPRAHEGPAFLGAGNVGRALGTLDLEALGGLVHGDAVHGRGFGLGAGRSARSRPRRLRSELLLYGAAFAASPRARTRSCLARVIAGLGLYGGPRRGVLHQGGGAGLPRRGARGSRADAAQASEAAGTCASRWRSSPPPLGARRARADRRRGGVRGPVQGSLPSGDTSRRGRRTDSRRVVRAPGRSERSVLRRRARIARVLPWRAARWLAESGASPQTWADLDCGSPLRRAACSTPPSRSRSPHRALRVGAATGAERAATEGNLPGTLLLAPARRARDRRALPPALGVVEALALRLRPRRAGASTSTCSTLVSRR